MKYYIIAGEASGDLHASNLIREINKLDQQANIRAWGGDLMQEQGAKIVKHYRDLAFMGFAEVILNLNTIVKNMAFCKKDLLAYRPDVLILIDYPGFNLRIAEFAHEQGIKVVYYISPQVWAWKKGRVKTIRKVVDKMLVILPFEKDFYRQNGLEVVFVGHPLLDALALRTNIDELAFRQQNKLSDKPIIALLPGSRKQELGLMLSEMLKMIPRFPSYQFVVAGAPSINHEIYEDLIGGHQAAVVYGQTYDLLRHAKAAMVTSGTATLETALLGTPEVVCYKGNKISFEIARRLVHVKYISLVNLIMDREVVTELIQDDLTVGNLHKELDSLLTDDTKLSRLRADYQELTLKLGGVGASAHAATEIIRMFN